MCDEDFKMVRKPVNAAQSLMAVQPAQPAKSAHAPQPSGAANRSRMWYMWRGQLHVGSIDVGPATLWSEHVTCIPALGEILKMTRIAKYEDLWHKILRSQPCQLSQRNAVSIRGRTVTVHRLSSHSRSFQQLVEELSETSKPQILTCQLLNEKHYVEVVLVPHCPELEQCGLQGCVNLMLHVVFVCRRSDTRITNLHKLLDVVDLSQACMIDPCAPTKNAKDRGQEASLQCCEKSDILEVKGSASEVCSCHSEVLNLTANTDELAEKRDCFSSYGAASLLSDGNVTEMSDNRHVGVKNELVNFDADQCISATTKKSVNQAEDPQSQSLEGDIGLVKSEAQDACGSVGGVQLMDEPAHQTEIRLSESSDSERNGVEYSTEDDGVREFVGHFEEDQKVKESARTTDIPKDDNCKTIQNSEKNTNTKEDKNFGASKKSKKSRKWNIHRFIKTQKPVINKKDLEKGKHTKHPSKLLKVSEAHLPKPTNLNNILLSDEKLRKEARVVVKKQSLEMLLHEAKERMGIHVKAPKMQKVNKNSMLDSKKLKDLFSLRDSNKPDLIKPSMLKRSYKECVIVKTLSIEDGQTSEPKACITPDILRCLEMNSEEEIKETSTNEVSNNHVTSGFQVKDSSENEILNCITKRQKTVIGDNCSVLEEKENKGCTIISKGKRRECLKNPPKMSSGNTSDSFSVGDSKNIDAPTTEVDICPSSEQSQELEDRCLCSIAEQTAELKTDDCPFSIGRQTSELKKDQCFCSNSKQTWKLANDRQISLKLSEQDLTHTAAHNARMQQNHEEHTLKGERKPNKKKTLKRKLESEWTEAIDDFHPRKRCCWIKMDSTKECLADSGNQVKDASSTMVSSSLVSPVACKILGGKSASEGSSSRSDGTYVSKEIQIPGSIEEQDKNKHQQQINEGEDIHCLKHTESFPPEVHEVSDHSKPEEKGQRNGFEGSCNKSTHNQDHNHNFYPHKSNYSESGNMKDTLELDFSGEHQTVEAERCNPAGERQPLGQPSAAQGSQCKALSPGLDSAESQFLVPQTNLADAAMPFPVSLKEMAHDSSQETIEARSSFKQELPSESKNLTDILYGEGIHAEHSEAKVRQDPVDLHCDSNICMKKCDKAEEETQEFATDCDLTSVHSASNQVYPKKMNSSPAQQCVSQSKQSSAGDSFISLSVNNLLQPPRDDSQSDKECKYSSENLSPEPVVTETSKSSSSDLPCPKVMAKRVQNNMKYYMLRVHSSLSLGLEGLNKKHECLPVLQASVDTFYIMSQNTSQPQKSLSSERKLTGVKKVLLETILKKMKLQLLRDANSISNMGQCLVSSGLKTLACFIEGQMASPPQTRGVPQALHRTMVKDMLESHQLLPELGKSLITQKVAELHHPYKMNEVQPLYVATYRTPVDSGLYTCKISQNPPKQEMPMNSLLATGSPPLDTGQQHSLPTPLKKCLSQESSFPSATSYSISPQPGHNTKTLGAIERAVFVPNELYQPLWEDFPLQAPLDWKQDSKYIHLFQGEQQEIIKLKCLLVAHKKSYSTLKDIEFYGGHVLAHHTVLHQLLASPSLPKLCASPCVSFGVYGTLAHVLQGRVAVVLAEKRLLLLLHHTSLLDPNTGDVLQAVSSSGLHLALVPAHTLHTCAYLLGRQPRTAAEEKLKDVLKQNLKHVMKCVEAGAGHILGGNRGSACATLSPESPITDHLTCLRVIHRCLNYVHRYTAVLIGEGVKTTASCHQPSVYQLCAAKEVLQHFLKVALHERN